MELLELEEGSPVRAADGTDLGVISRLVVDPSRSAITHLVVQKGILFAEDRVIPVEHIADVDESGVVLSRESDYKQMPEYEADAYVEEDRATDTRLPSNAAVSLWRFPMMQTGMFPMYPAYPPSGSKAPEEVRPETMSTAASSKPDLELLDESTRVVTADGKRLGNVVEVAIKKDGNLSHLVVDLGFLQGHRLLPAHWIDSIDGQQIRIAVSKQALAKLPEVT
ncbi:MAG: DUF2171 domain-containing protein [Actinobacteria bacterium]|nr:MAG: DUF2171 domain-containing protein [Actinomycetota bacterium]REK38783.1 MAG: DUF2171 domain-containing protein [Actinomycetota bacterium]